MEDVPRNTGSSTPDPGWRDAGWLVALAFWLCLVAAAGLYALVALAPPYLTSVRLEAEHHGHQARLVALELEVERLARVSTALTDEPDYAAELARIDFRTAVAGAELIPVEPLLQLGDGKPPVTPARPAVLPWPALVLEPFASQAGVRRGTLAAAGLLVVFAFGFLHEGHAEQADAMSRGLRGAVRRLVARYRRSGPVERPVCTGRSPGAACEKSRRRSGV